MKFIKYKHLVFIAIFFFITVDCKKDNEYNPSTNEQESVAINIATIKTSNITSITSNSAIAGGNITNIGGAKVTQSGIVWDITKNPTIEQSKGITKENKESGEFESKLLSLESNTTYYVRAYAINKGGTAYGDQELFSTLPANGTLSIVDSDGNSYTNVTIGTQIWLSENLKTTKLNNGTPIPNIKNGTEWRNLSTPGYCLMDIGYYGTMTESKYKKTFGLLYNWYAVSTGKLCPEGWHIPTDKDWHILINLLGGENIAGGKLKLTGTFEGNDGLWYSPNIQASNESGFSALPGGYRNTKVSDSGGKFDSNFMEIGSRGMWWGSENLYLFMRNDGSNANLFKIESSNKGYGLSIRCIMD